MQVSTPSHCQFQQRHSRNNVGFVQTVLDTIVERIHLLQNAIAGIQVVTIVEIVFKCIVGGIGDHSTQHFVCHRDVNARPHIVRHVHIVSELRAIQHTIFVGLVVPRPHDRPAPSLHIEGTLDNGIVLHTHPFFIHCLLFGIQRNADLVRIRIARRARLKHARCTCPTDGNALEICWQYGRDVLARQSLARVYNLPPRISRDEQHPLKAVRFQFGVVHHIFVVEAQQEVNTVLVRGFPFVAANPRTSLQFTHGCHGRHTRCKDETVRWVLELGVQHPRNCLFHPHAITCKEQLGLDAHRGIARQCDELRTQVVHKEARAPKTRGLGMIPHIFVRGKQRKSLDVVATEAVDVEDQEQVSRLNELSVQEIPKMSIFPCLKSRPHNFTLVVHTKHIPIPRNKQSPTLTVCLVCHGIPLKNVPRTILAKHAAIQGDQVEESVVRATELLGVLANARVGKQECAALVRGQQALDDADHRRDHLRLLSLSAQILNFQFVTHWQPQHVGQRIATIARLDHGEVDAEFLGGKCVGQAMQNTNECLGIHDGTRMITPNLTLRPQRESREPVCHVQRIALTCARRICTPTSLLSICKVAGLSFDHGRDFRERLGRADLVNVRDAHHRYAKTILVCIGQTVLFCRRRAG